MKSKKGIKMESSERELDLYNQPVLQILFILERLVTVVSSWFEYGFFFFILFYFLVFYDYSAEKFFKARKLENHWSLYLVCQRPFVAHHYYCLYPLNKHKGKVPVLSLGDFC